MVTTRSTITSLPHSNWYPPRRRALACWLAVSAATSLVRAADPLAFHDVTPSSFKSDSNLRISQGVDFGNGVFVAVGNNFSLQTGKGDGYSFTSSDGANWVTHKLSFVPSGKVRFAKGKFHTYQGAPNGFGQTMSSTDGVNWSAHAESVQLGPLEDLAVGGPAGGVLVAARGAGLAGPGPSYSADGISFNATTLPSPGNLTVYSGLTYGAGSFALVGAGLNAPYYYTSPDGRTWAAGSGLDNGFGYEFITFGNGTFLTQEHAVPGRQLLSSDGVHWTPAQPGLTQNIPGVGTIPQALRNGRFLNGRFVGINATSGLSASTDGQKWAMLADFPANQNDLRDVAFGAGHYVTVSTDHIFSAAAGGNPPPGSKAADLSVTFDSVKVAATSAKVKFNGSLDVSNLGSKTAKNVEVGFYLSADKRFSVAKDHFIELVSLADYGFKQLPKESHTGALHLKVQAKLEDLGGSLTGKYLLVIVDPRNNVPEGNETNNVFAYGPLP